MINNFEEIDQLFSEINNSLHNKTNIYIIGGAALLRRGIKEATKDIDLVVSTKQEFFEIQNALRIIGFKSQIPEREYAHMNLSQIFQRKDFRIDLFERNVCARFSLSENMIKRAEKVIALSNMTVFLCSNEDIFLLKTMTEREGDITDCINIVSTQNPNWEIILKELKEQIKQSKQDVWITWVGERLDMLQDRGIDIPIMKELNELRNKFFKDLEKKHQSK